MDNGADMKARIFHNPRCSKSRKTSNIKNVPRINKSDSKNHNKKMHTKNGNIKNNLKIMQWNKGSSNISRRISEIKEMVQKNSPEILSSMRLS